MTAPLRKRLREPATIDELYLWCREDEEISAVVARFTRGKYLASFVNNMLAWLSIAGVVRYCQETRKWGRGSDYDECDARVAEILRGITGGRCESGSRKFAR